MVFKKAFKEGYMIKKGVLLIKNILGINVVVIVVVCCYVLCLGLAGLLAVPCLALAPSHSLCIATTTRPPSAAGGGGAGAGGGVEKKKDRGELRGGCTKRERPAEKVTKT